MKKQDRPALNLTRRDALKNLAVAAGAASVPAWLAACGEPSAEEIVKRGPLTGDETRGPLTRDEVPIDTVVVLMMENRSFDHYFSSLRIDEGRTDIRAMTAETFNEDFDGNRYHPQLATRMCVEDPPHGFGAGHTQYAGGTNAGFVKAHLEEAHGGEALPQTVMSYHNRAQLPLFYNLADDYTLCQQWFCAMMGPTWPNRWYAHGAQSNGEVGNNFGGDYSFEMIYDRLADKGLTHRYYYVDLPFLNISSRYGQDHPRTTSLISRFFQDAEEGTLPNYCFVDPGFNLNDDHPPHHVGLGQQFVSSIYHALAKSPQWDRTILFVTYDENGGFFDHVAPPAVEDDWKSVGIDKLGFRVPGFVVGPWVKQQVSDVQYDHTSMLAFTEWLFDLKPLTKRDAAANNFVDDVLDAARIRSRDPRKPKEYAPVLVPDSEITDACRYSASFAGQQHDVHMAANLGLIPRELDKREFRLDMLRMIARREAARAGIRLY